MALADLSLLVGYTNKAGKLGFQEVLKAINAMSGQGESLPYVGEEHEPTPRPRPPAARSAGPPPWKPTDYPAAALRTSPIAETSGTFEIPRPVFAAAAILVIILAACFAGYRYMWNASPAKNTAVAAPAKTEEAKPAAPEGEVKEPLPAPGPPAPAANPLNAPATVPANPQTNAPAAPLVAIASPSAPATAPAVAQTTAPNTAAATTPAAVPAAPPAKAPASAPVPVPAPAPPEPKAQAAQPKEPVQEKKETRPAAEKTAVVVAEGANIRNAPRLNAARVDLVLMGRTVKVMDQKKDGFGRTWYMVKLQDGKQGWIHQNVVRLR